MRDHDRREPLLDGGLCGVDLTLCFGSEPVVRAASIDVRPGRVTALVGPNGSGKSTLLRSIARLHHPEHGDVRFDDGSSALALSPRDFARRVTLLTQSRPTPAGITVRDVVESGRHPYRRGWRGTDPDGTAALEWAMSVTGVSAMAERSVDQLSGGERQRVWVAACLCQRTSVVLLDEPTTFLDLRYQVELLDLVRDLADVHGVAIGIVLHDLQQAADVADEVVVLEAGRVVATGPPAEAMTSHHLSRAFGIAIDVDRAGDGGLRIATASRASRRAHQLA